jgi:hypothetical protein
MADACRAPPSRLRLDSVDTSRQPRSCADADGWQQVVRKKSKRRVWERLVLLPSKNRGKVPADSTVSATSTSHVAASIGHVVYAAASLGTKRGIARVRGAGI